MRYLVYSLASMIGLDPLTFLVLGLLAGICAWWMKEMMPNPWMAFAFYPALLSGGALAVALATAAGIADHVDVRVDADGDMTSANWTDVCEQLPMIVTAGIAGMCLAAVSMSAMVRSLQHFV